MVEPPRSAPEPVTINDLPHEARDVAVPVIVDSFTGIYRWHAKRTLYRIDTVRGAWVDDRLVGISLLEYLDPAVGYVYYIAVLREFRGHGVAKRLLDDALDRFRRGGARVVYAAAEEDNEPSLRLFRSHGFRVTEPKETGWREGGLGAWGYRSRMMVVSGEVLLGLRLAPEPRSDAARARPTEGL